MTAILERNTNSGCNATLELRASSGSQITAISLPDISTGNNIFTLQ